MIALDDRTGNILTTIAAFIAVVVVVFVARATLFVFVLALLLAYLLEPIVAGVERLMPRLPHARSASIAVVYAIGVLLVVFAGHALAPRIADQRRQLDAALPELVARINRTTAAGYGELVAEAAARIGGVVAVAARDIGWLLMVPVVTIFLLGHRATFLENVFGWFARRDDGAAARRTIRGIDLALAEYARAQTILAGLSAAFYVGAMLLLRFPFPLVLGLAGGALELVPAFGWIIAAIAIVASGALAHGHWIWMTALLVGWRIVQNFVTAPRLIGDRLQMEPLVVLLSLMVGGQLAGPAGVIVSVPAVAVLRIICQQVGSR